MRTSYFVCYDNCNDKRLRKVFQIMRGFRDYCRTRDLLLRTFFSLMRIPAMA